ncbi:hypothetical protein [Candidatus Palauibacter sp.]|uniref:hypothetical protein n=1 Tax=Candidatus Palauibacter sp. TaxID=3101350 RepID=UPI003D0A1512
MRLRARLSARLRATHFLAACAVVIGLAGVSATGCLDLNVGPTVPSIDSTEDTALDEPGNTNPGNSIVPILPESR